MRATPPVAFVTLNRDVWPELRNADPNGIDEACLARHAVDSFNCWIMTTHVRLAQAGFPSVLSPLPRPGFINIANGRDLGKRQRGVRPFIVVTRADGHEPKLANYWIAQNGLTGQGPGHGWVPHWPQPGIRPRDPARGLRIERLVYKGEVRNLDPKFRSDAFAAQLRELGVALRLDTPSESNPAPNWGDYADADLSLAVRDLTEADAKGKPASKLVNSWIAGVPALLGPEPAFAELRRDPLDYIEVRAPADVVAALRRFRDDPQLHARMVAHGAARARDFAIDAVAARWVDLLRGPIFDAFERWEKSPLAWKGAWAAAQSFREGRSKRRYRDSLGTGPRILSGPPTLSADASTT